MLIDTHCHLYFDAFNADRGEVLQRMRAAGVGGAVIIGIDELSNEQARQTAALAPELHYAAGLHPTSVFPTEVRDGAPFNAAAYLSSWLEQADKPVAIGECGIDLHWDTNGLEQQATVFKAQLELGRELDLPVVVHTREADSETRQILELVPGAWGVFHCFDGSRSLLDFAQAANARGDRWYISFAGNLTYKQATDLRLAAGEVPLDRLLIETDAPFLAPQAKRGKRNEPAYVVHTASALARLRGIAEEVMQAQLLSNSRDCFKVAWD